MLHVLVRMLIEQLNIEHSTSNDEWLFYGR